MKNYRNRDLLDLAHHIGCKLQFPCCTGGTSSDPAHSNASAHGKGMSIKAHDCFFAAGCRECHRELDQGRTMTREEKEHAWRRGHVAAASIVDFEQGRWTEVERSGRSLATLARIRAGRTAHGARFLTAYYGNEHGGRSLERPVGTITTRDRWAIIDGDRMRMLSVPECRRAMGFPADYLLPDRARDAMHMLGNAVVPQVACDVIQALRAAA